MVSHPVPKQDRVNLKPCPVILFGGNLSIYPGAGTWLAHVKAPGNGPSGEVPAVETCLMMFSTCASVKLWNSGSNSSLPTNITLPPLNQPPKLQREPEERELQESLSASQGFIHPPLVSTFSLHWYTNVLNNLNKTRRLSWVVSQKTGSTIGSNVRREVPREGSECWASQNSAITLRPY